MPPRIFGSCASLNELCALCVVAGDLDRAVEFGEQGLAISEHRGELFIRGYLLTFLAQASWLRGERPRAEALARDTGLTRRQLEIARLIAEDLTNRQIADRLFCPNGPWKLISRTCSTSSA